MEIRDVIVDFIGKYGAKTDLPDSFFTKEIGIRKDRLCEWKNRYGKVNSHNGKIPRDHWLEEWEKLAIVSFYQANQGDGYRRCCYMMMDQDVVHVSASAVYNTLQRAGVIRKWNRKLSKKGTGFKQPKAPHEQWHIDIANVRVDGVFYYLICILDGYSRSIVQWDLRTEMKNADVGVVMQAAKEKFPDAKPRYISDNGKQFTGREFKNFICNNDLTHVKTSPYYPQSNGKLERFHKSIKSECIRTQCPLTYEDAKRIIAKYVEYYNNERLHSAIDYVTPRDKMEGRAEEVLKGREEKLTKRREERMKSRQVSPKDILEETRVA
jgi:transposase InsO family protein